jgi:hypothetical protein
MSTYSRQSNIDSYSLATGFSSDIAFISDSQPQQKASDRHGKERAYVAFLMSYRYFSKGGYKQPHSQQSRQRPGRAQPHRYFIYVTWEWI